MKIFFNPLFLSFFLFIFFYNAPIDLTSASSSRSSLADFSKVHEAQKFQHNTQGKGEQFHSEETTSSNGPSNTKKSFVFALFVLLTGIAIYNVIYQDFSPSNDINI
ncbi:hypothetical protein [Alphaproteobacteria bacterium endosymbiont of Tiliacea citrago]|uniref:hypothetical protein n=1 Tax=Alphaproteobacteria bacterium endosymbiont of Tiliacea citrago TaxID=3077944 RepID=UPI00313CE0A6